MGERLQERTKKINKNISWKGGMVPEQRFFRFLQCCTRNKRNLKIAEPPKMIGKVETDTINRERGKTMITVLEVQVTTNITHINLQQRNPIKMTKKNGLHLLKLRKWKGEKSDHFLVK